MSYYGDLEISLQRCTWKRTDFAQIATAAIGFHHYEEEASPALLDHPLFIVLLSRERGEGKGGKLYRELKDTGCY